MPQKRKCDIESKSCLSGGTVIPEQETVIINIDIKEITNTSQFKYKQCLLEIMHNGMTLNKEENIESIFDTLQCITSENFPISDENKDLESCNYESISLNIHYALALQKDIIRDLNAICDSPLFIRLYGLRPPEPEPEPENDDMKKSLKREGSRCISPKQQSSSKNLSKKQPISKKIEEDDGGEFSSKCRKCLLAYGYIELFPLLNSETVNYFENIFLYPHEVNPDSKTPMISIHLYAFDTLYTKHLTNISNYAVITLESIFNLEPIDIVEADVEVFFTLIKDDDTKEPLCAFKNGKFRTLNTLPKYRRWASLPNYWGQGVFSHLTIETATTGIYGEAIRDELTESCEFLAFHSMHFIVLSEAYRTGLENFINYNHNNLFVEMKYKNEVVLNGYVDLMPLLYPGVRKGRFRVDFTESITVTNKRLGMNLKATKSKKSLTSLAKSKSVETLPGVPIFQKPGSKCYLLFEIDFHHPITQQFPGGLDRFEISKFQLCKAEPLNLSTKDKISELIRCSYKEFRDIIIKFLKALPKCLYEMNLKTYNIDEICKRILEIKDIQDFQESLMGKIMKLVAIKFNIDQKTTNNIEFRNLMVLTYNKLIIYIEEIVNDYFAGIQYENDYNNDVVNRRIFTENECFELQSLIDFKIIQRKTPPMVHSDIKDILNLIIKNLKLYKFDEARSLLEKLFSYDSQNYYGLLINAYLMYKTEPQDVWLGYLLNISESHENELEIWTLLFAIYENSNYKAGYTHSQMKIDTNIIKWDFPFFWLRREFYFNQPLHKEYCNTLCLVVYVFLIMGLYEFANLLYEKCSSDYPTEMESLRVKLAILFLLREYQILEKIIEDLPVTPQNRFLLQLYFGHLAYMLDKYPVAKSNYEIVYHFVASNEFNHLAYLRLGYWDIRNKNYQFAKTYFITCAKTNDSFLSWFGLGICHFMLEKYLDAEKAFSKATNYELKICETWLFLALIRLKFNDYVNSLKCYNMSLKDFHLTEHNQWLWQEINDIFAKQGITLPNKFQ